MPNVITKHNTVTTKILIQSIADGNVFTMFQWLSPSNNSLSALQT